MVQFQWHDGSVKNIHVDMSLLFEYQKQLYSTVRLYEKRIEWLASGSRRIFGTIVEKKLATSFTLTYRNELSMNLWHIYIYMYIKMFSLNIFISISLNRLIVKGGIIMNKFVMYVFQCCDHD